jgi:hypothetical protein
LNKLVWLLCSRSGGGVCRPEPLPQRECIRTHRCSCEHATELGSAT